MDRKEFERLYIRYERESMEQTEIRAGSQLRIDWDMFDECRISFDGAKVISKTAARQDVSCFFLLLKYAYSGFEYYTRNVDFRKIEKQVIVELGKDPAENISVVDLCNIIHSDLSPYINDGHVWLECADNEFLFLKSYVPYVTDIVVKRGSGQFVVIQGEGALQPGIPILREDIRGELFRTVVPGCEEECYLVGCYTERDPGNIEIAGQPCKTHVLKCCNAKRLADKLYSLSEESKYAVFRNPTYQIYEKSSAHERNFSDAGKKCAPKDFVIWDLSGNHGGNSIFPETYLRALNGCVYAEMDTAILQSPIVGNSETDKFYRWERACGFDGSNASFGGELFIVMNKETGSSAEDAVFLAKSCRKVTTVGAPSSGVGIFGEVRSYRLPNSGILAGLPYKVFYQDGFEIGKGYMPDYWIDDENPVEYLLRCIRQIRGVNNEP